MSAQIKLKDRTKYDEYVMVYKSLCTNTSTKKELVNDRSSTDSVILENRISTSTKHYLVRLIRKIIIYQMNLKYDMLAILLLFYKFE